MGRLMSAVRPDGGSSGGRISTAARFSDWIGERSAAEPAEPFTFVFGMDGVLRPAPWRSEHVACAGGARMLSAGEIGFVRGAGRRVVSKGSNHSTGYCHDTVSWPEVARALGDVGLEHPPDSPISWCSGGALAADGSTSYGRVALFPRSPEHSDADSMNAFVDEFINWFHREDPATHPDRSPARHGERAAAVTRLEVGADPAEPRAHIGADSFDRLPLAVVPGPPGVHDVTVRTASGREVTLRRDPARLWTLPPCATPTPTPAPHTCGSTMTRAATR